MIIHNYGNKENPSLLLIPGLGVSYELFLPLIELLKEDFYILSAEVDGFTIGKYTRFTSIDDQAGQVISYVKEHLNGRLDCAYGLSMGGKILSRVLERKEINVRHAILDGAPLLPLPRWLRGPLRYYQCCNVWTCYHWTGFWKWLFHSHYFDVLLDECRKVWPYGKGRAVLDAYKDIYSHKLESMDASDLHFWYGVKEAFVAKPQAKHLLRLAPNAQIDMFPAMNHGQLLIDHPEEVARRIACLTQTWLAHDGQ